MSKIKKFFLKNIKHKIAVFLICTSFYFVLIVLSLFTPLGKMYTFGWTYEHLYFWNWIPVALLIIFDKLPASLAITTGNFAGVFLGEFFGKVKITPDMTEEEVAMKIGLHYGWAIWAITVLCFTVAGFIYTAGRFGRL